MKSTEFTKSKFEMLKEDLEQNNDTGFLTEDLVKIADQHFNGTWSKPMTLEEALDFDRMILEGKLPK
jgi:hypothetical protein